MAIKKRNPIVVLLLTLITLGIYGIYWVVKTTVELREAGGKSAPNPWLLLLMLVPLVNFFAMIYYYYKYSVATEEVSGGSLNRWLMFVLWIVIGIVAMVLTQLELNKHANA